MENINNPKLNLKLNPWYVTGFSDGEACFHIAIGKNIKYKNGFYVNPGFSIVLHKKDKILLEKLQAYFGGIGTLKTNDKIVEYRIFSMKDLKVIIDHFDNYPLITKKQIDYMLFKETLELIKNKEHLTVEGLQKIVNIRASMNKGLPETLKKAFPTSKRGLSRLAASETDAIPHTKSLVTTLKVIDPNWVVGFTEAEGCFFVKTHLKNERLSIQLGCQITQHNRDILLLKSLMDLFNCGRLEPVGESSHNFITTKLSDITKIIIPFFDKYPLIGSKAEDFKDWNKISELMTSKAHLCKEGREQIIQIKSRINTSRTWEEK